MVKIIVLGIGNQLLMDDGIGIYLTEELARSNVNSHIEYLIGESDIDYCLSQIEDANFVLILDAVLSEKKPGELTVYPLDTLHSYQSLDLSPHNLHLFQALYQQRETIKGFLIGVEPSEIKFHIGLSQVIEEEWSSILCQVSRLIDGLMEKESS